MAIVFVATKSSEGSDRKDLSLPDDQDALISAVAAAQKNTAVVVHTPGSLSMPWASSVKAILNGWMPGQEDGNAIADVLFGDVNPSARLPVSFPAPGQNPLPTVAQYPGVNNVAHYTEALQVGYRWYDSNGQDPAFPFGHGLSYTTFKYDTLKIENSQKALLVSFVITNTGKRDGAEIPQLYISYPKTAGEPPRVLRDFQKVELKAGEKKPVLLTVSKEDESLQIWDVAGWKTVPGSYLAHVAASSRDIRLSGSFSL